MENPFREIAPHFIVLIAQIRPTPRMPSVGIQPPISLLSVYHCEPRCPPCDPSFPPLISFSHFLQISYIQTIPTMPWSVPKFEFTARCRRPQ
jgi:hypothetical protein